MAVKRRYLDSALRAVVDELVAQGRKRESIAAQLGITPERVQEIKLSHHRQLAHRSTVELDRTVVLERARWLVGRGIIP